MGEGKCPLPTLRYAQAEVYKLCMNTEGEGCLTQGSVQRGSGALLCAKGEAEVSE